MVVAWLRKIAAPSRAARPRATVDVWGCRGSAAAPGAAFARYGGDTTCYGLTFGERAPILIDCGSGLRAFGAAIAHDPPKQPIDVLLTHFHVDHLIGLGLCGPLLSGDVALRLWTTQAPDAAADAIDRLFSPPLWPFNLRTTRRLEIQGLPADMELNGVSIRPFPLNHPGGSTGFALEADGVKVSVATDHEHGDETFDMELTKASEGAQLMLFDAPYSDETYERRRGWGHSSRAAGLALARAAAVERLVFVHHDPNARDADLDAVGRGLADRAPFAELARQGARYHL